MKLTVATIVFYLHVVIKLVSVVSMAIIISRTPCVSQFVEGDTVLGVLPFFHIYGKTVVLLFSLFEGLKVVTLPRFEPESFLSAVQDHRV